MAAGDLKLCLHLNTVQNPYCRDSCSQIGKGRGGKAGPVIVWWQSKWYFDEIMGLQTLNLCGSDEFTPHIVMISPFLSPRQTNLKTYSEE